GLQSASRDTLLDEVSKSTVNSVIQALKLNLSSRGWSVDQITKISEGSLPNAHEVIKKAVAGIDRAPEGFTAVAAAILRHLSIELIVETVVRDRRLDDLVLTARLNEAIKRSGFA